MEPSKKLINIPIVVLALAIAGSFIYYFIIRPIQREAKFDACLMAAGSIQNNEWYKYQRDFCVRVYGQNK